MEPAADGRDDESVDVAPESSHTAAMEPAADGRDDAEQIPAFAELHKPQWSPPLMGGMTRALRPDQVGHVRAAMEPAADGRDDPAAAPFASLPAASPQWSPPLMGGMTALHPAYPPVIYWPQWSPPLMGGMTAREKRAS